MELVLLLDNHRTFIYMGQVLKKKKTGKESGKIETIDVLGWSDYR